MLSRLPHTCSLPTPHCSYGFPNQISALRFEWAWQNPGRSTRLKELPKTLKATPGDKVKVLAEMLRTPTWVRPAPAAAQAPTPLHPTPPRSCRPLRPAQLDPTVLAHPHPSRL